MAYNKKNWQDNVSDITAAELNKIEQGIYDNSLVVDAVTNTLNPTDTETYKTAELTEGQITDVIGVNDIVIKGQTSQNGEPTPSSPVDVNVVSGSNVINTSNKNFANMTKLFGNSSYYSINHGQLSVTANDGRTWDNLGNDWGIELLAGTYMLSTSKGTTTQVQIQGKNSGQITRGAMTNGTKSFTLQQADIIGIKFLNISTYPKEIGTVQIELGSTATTYEPHQGKELPLDLPVENLFDEVWEQGTISNTTGENSSGSNVRRSVNYISVLPNTTYVFSRTISGNTMPIREYGANKQFIGNKSPFDGRISSLSQTFTTSSDVYFIRLVDFVNNSNNKVMIEQGSKANAYTPYGTDPIELCKIGDYQDYFYKSGSKWYLHKEIGKIVLDGSENWGKASDINNHNRYSVALSTGANNATLLCYSNYFKGVTRSGLANANEIAVTNYINILIDNITTDTDFKTWLASNNVTLYYVLATATDTEITGTLKEQLEAIYNAPLYEQTNITQTNNDLPMVLDITACKDNINGIKAFIRK